MIALVAEALAADPTLPVMEPTRVVEEFRAWAAAEGRSGDAAEIVCGSQAEALLVCFARGTKGFYTRAEKFDAAQLLARVDLARPLDGMVEVPVEGMTGSYWLRAVGDGRDHVPMLTPAALKEKLGGDPVVAVPVRGALVAWLPGDPEFDKVVGVGVLRMYETLPEPVSPLLYRWRDGKWTTWGVAKPATGG